MAVAERARLRGQIITGANSLSALNNTRRYYAPEFGDTKIEVIPNPTPDIIPVRPPENEDLLCPIQNLLIPNRGVVLGEALRSAIDVLDIPKITVLAWEQDRHTNAVQDAMRLEQETNGRVKVVFAGADTQSPSDVYANTDLIIKTAQEYGCDRVDLGWGFLAENHAEIAKMEKAGLYPVGPTSDQVKTWGHKANALRIAENAGVPVLPWVDGASLTTWEEIEQAVANLTFPLMMKAN
ncbi:MAG: hypothetical protein HYV39_01035, partial [Candidatus Levybacteria bacterium]|nr:hypothetical protein [Candidatus Levybacteria bacterium]